MGLKYWGSSEGEDKASVTSGGRASAMARHAWPEANCTCNGLVRYGSDGHYFERNSSGADFFPLQRSE